MTDLQVTRLRGERGTAIVTALVLLFSFTAGAVIWLARDVDRVVSNRSAAQSIAFQAARSGAQQVVVNDLRVRTEDAVVIDLARAQTEAHRTANRLFDEYHVDGLVTVVRLTNPHNVVVELTIRDPTGDVTGVGSAEAQRG